MANLNRARKAFEDFTGHKAREVTRAKLDDQNVAGWKLGPAVGVAYEAKRDGETARYFHEFKKSARPDLVARDDGRQLYFTGGRYKVTDRGIEDMPALLVVNPSARAGAKRKAKPMAKKTARRRKAAPARARRQTIVFRNPAPKRRRRRAGAAHTRRFRRNPSARRGARRALSGALNFGKMFLPAAAIGLGAVGAELLLGYMPIPAQFKTGPLRQVTKGVVAVAAGMLISKVLKQPKIGNAVALGGVVIAVHDFVKEIAVARMPALQFGMYTPPMKGLGYYNPASTVSLGQYVNTPAGGFHGASADGYASTPNFRA